MLNVPLHFIYVILIKITHRQPVKSTVTTFLNTNTLTYITVINLFNSAFDSTITFIYDYKKKGLGSLVGIVAGYGFDSCGSILAGTRILSSLQSPDRTWLFHCNPLFNGYRSRFCQGRLKWPEREDDHTTRSTKVKVGGVMSTPLQ
jgi:hypothetical protein